MVADGRDSLLIAWWPPVLAGLAITFTVMGVNMLGIGCVTPSILDCVTEHTDTRCAGDPEWELSTDTLSTVRMPRGT
jgi:hypothetical protein